jgi:hypothetical protein
MAGVRARRVSRIAWNSAAAQAFAVPGVLCRHSWRLSYCQCRQLASWMLCIVGYPLSTGILCYVCSSVLRPLHLHTTCTQHMLGASSAPGGLPTCMLGASSAPGGLPGCTCLRIACNVSRVASASSKSLFTSRCSHMHRHQFASIFL